MMRFLTTGFLALGLLLALATPGAATEADPGDEATRAGETIVTAQNTADAKAKAERKAARKAAREERKKRGVPRDPEDREARKAKKQKQGNGEAEPEEDEAREVQNPNANPQWSEDAKRGRERAEERREIKPGRDREAAEGAAGETGSDALAAPRKVKERDRGSRVRANEDDADGDE